MNDSRVFVDTNIFLYAALEAEKGLPFPVKLSQKAAEEHERWFQQQVEAAVKEADTPDAVFIPHAQVCGRWAAKGKEIAQRTTRQRKRA